MRLKEYMLNEGKFKDAFGKAFKALKNMPFNKVKKTLQDAWKKILPDIYPQEDEILRILNGNLKTNFSTLKQVTNGKVNEDLNEDWKHFREMLGMEAFPTLSFFPALTAWIEIGKLLEPGMDVNWTKFGVYALFWFLLVSGRFVKQFLKWKKENPAEYYAERPHLKEHNNECI